MVNEVKIRMEGTPHEYGKMMKAILETVQRSKSTDDDRKRWPEYYKIRADLSINDHLLFRDGTRFIPDERLRTRVMREAHGIHIGR